MKDSFWGVVQLENEDNHMKKLLTLTLEQIKNLRNTLETQRGEILGHGKVLKINFNVQQDEIKDEADVASMDVEQGMSMRLGNRESLYFKKVEEALLRIKDGTYGKCTECSNDIGLRRLLARPTAELCIECKESHEKSEMLSADGRRYKSLGEMINFKN